MGLNLFVASAVGNVSIHKIAHHALPYVLILVLVWLLVAIFPPLSIGLL
jgi:C4-dicarboxylate transporter DctM subunit